MSLFDILHVGGQGITAQQSMIQVAGQNITNAGVTGYRRRSALLTTVATIPGAAVGGVRVDGVVQSRDAFLARELVSGHADLGHDAAMRETLETIEPWLDDLGNDGLGAAIEHMFSAIGDMSADPSNLEARNEVLSAVESFSARMRQTASAFQSTRDGADRQLVAESGELNDALARIATLNKDIAGREGARQDASDLRDERDALVQSASEALGLDVLEQSDGTVTLLTNGQAVVQGDVAARVLLQAAAPGERPSLYLAHGDDAPVSLSGPIRGRLGGLLDARDEVAGPALEALDALAFELATAMNDVHRGGVGLDGLAGRAMFDVSAGASGAASTLQLSSDLQGAPERLAAAGDIAGIPGDNTVARALLDVADSSSFGADGDGSPRDALGAVANSVARSLSGAKTDEEAGTAVLAQVKQLHDSRTGVSIEEELVNITAAQRSLEAASRTVRVANELMQVVLSMV